MSPSAPWGRRSSTISGSRSGGAGPISSSPRSSPPIPGSGFVIWSARRYVKTPEVMAGVVVIGLIGLLTDQLLRVLHRRMFRYL